MLKFILNISDRKVLVNRIGELLETRPKYTGVPRCAYVIGDYTVERNGNLVVDEERVNTGIIQALQSEGLIGIMHSESGAFQPVAVRTSAPVQAASEIEADTVSIEESETETFPKDATISLPLADHTGTTLKNLICLIYSRGDLLSKAVGGEFLVDQSVIDTIEEKNPASLEDLRNCLNAMDDGILGFRLEADNLVFDGFTNVKDAEHLRTYTKLVNLMNTMALTQKRIQAKTVDSTNEKYALRIWLIRLGMNGDEFKEDRKYLMENLSGHTAFRTEEAQEKAKQKALHKKGQSKQAVG